MGIKDKVLDILFDDDNDVQDDNQQEQVKRERRTTSASSTYDTGSVFIDATSPLPKTLSNNRKDSEENEYREKKESTYQMSENISPIFGPIGSKNKKNKNLSKVKSINDISNKKFESTPKAQPYSKVVISPIYGPISTKPTKKVKPRKKDIDPFYRDINDTGSFDTVLSENEEDVLDQQIEQANLEAEEVEQTEKMGDTDRLVRISDRINRIKNEAANLYHDEESNDDIIEEDGYDVETIEYSSISEVIHDVQNHDEKMDHTPIVVHQEEPANNSEPVNEQVEEDPFEEIEDSENISFDKPADEPVKETVEPASEPIKENVEEPKTEPVEVANTQSAPVEEKPKVVEQDKKNDFDIPAFNPNNTVDNTPNGVLSEDDIFNDQDSDEGKDLFSVLFGDD